MVLTDKQREELHNAIWGYLKQSGLGESAAAFQKEGGIKVETADEKAAVEEAAKYADVLETKWRSIVRLQKRIMELEEEVKAAGEKRGGVQRMRDQAVLPKESEPKYSLTGHRDAISCVVVHPLYEVVVSSSEDSSIKVWDLGTGKFERSLQGHTDAVNCIAFNAEGTMLASCSTDLTIKLWDFDTFSCIKTMVGHDRTVSAVCFSPSGDQLVSCSRDEKVKLWDLTTGYCTKTFTGHTNWVKCISISSNGHVIASSGMDQAIRLWNIVSGQCLHELKGHDHVVEAVIFSNPATDMYQLEVRDPSAPSSSTTTKKESILSGLDAFAISACRDRTIKIWSTVDGSCVRTLLGHENWVRSLSLHGCGKYLFSCGDDKTIRIWDLTKMDKLCCVRVIPNPEKTFFSSIAWSDNTGLLVTGSMGNKVCVWH